MKSAKNLWIAIGITAVWLTITIGGGNLQGGGHSTLEQLVSRGVLWAIVAAIAFLGVATAVLRWNGLGFARADWIAALKLQWFPLLIVTGIFAVAVLNGLPAPVTVGWILLNCLLVGISEEWAFRGIVFRGCRDRFAIIPSIWLCAVLFGFSHASNVFVTGNLPAALQQASAATMSGLLFTVLRVRLRSLYPVMLLHGFWDFAIFCLSSTRPDDLAKPAPQLTGGLAILAPIIMALPTFLYALYLMRRVERDEP